MKKKSDSLWALLDQAATSGGNFAIVALGAHFLPLAEQSKLVYVYTAYVAAVLVNAAAIFSAAPVVNSEVENGAGYRSFLLLLQTKLAVSFSLFATVLLWLGSGFLGWKVDWQEFSVVALFLLIQQLADFQRRAGYVFTSARSSALASGLIFIARIGFVVGFAPRSACEMVFLLAACSLPVAIIAFRGFCVAIRKEYAGRHWRLARWNVISVPLVWTMMHSPVYFAGSLAGPAAAAVYAALRSLSSVANVLLELLETYVPVLLLRRIERTGGRKSDIRRMFFLILLVGGGMWGVGMLSILCWGEVLISLVLGINYQNYVDVLAVLWLGNGLYFIGRLIGVVQRVVGCTIVEFSGSIAGVAVLLLGIPLVIRYGALGAAWMLVFVQTAIVIAQAVVISLRRKRFVALNQ